MSLGEYVRLLQMEMAATAERFAVSCIPTVHMGGGTPSLLSPPLVKELLEAADLHHSLDADAEITMEANPGTVTLDSLSGYRAAGVNRLSLGIQSLDDRQLALLGRIHTADQARDALKLARRAGFANVGIDLMHSLPGQSLAQWEATLRQAVELEPEHVSAYGLSIEEGTPFADLASSGKLLLPDEEAAAEMFELTAGFLISAGYEHYEISNFARDEASRSRHNGKYWRHVPYLGLGPSAHSFDGATRWWNLRSVKQYCRALDKDSRPVEGSEMLTAEQLRLERLCLGMRTRDGICLADVSITSSPEDALSPLTQSGLVRLEDGRILPTLEGFLVADRLPLMFPDR